MPPSLEKDISEEDTIVVTGEHDWSRMSSPESMSPEIEPLVANLLRQINDPHNQHLESPEPIDEDTLVTKPISPLSRKRHRPSRANLIPAEERLAQMPQLCPLPWREGVEPGSDKERGGISRRKQIRFGCLLATKGEIQEIPCSLCASGRGKFKVCVALDDFHKGSCASCQLSGQAQYCSIKKNDEATESPSIKTIKPRPSLSNDDNQTSSSDRMAKRRRKETAKPVPDWESARPQWEQELGDSQARQRLNEIVQRPCTTENHSSVTTASRPMVNGTTGARSVPQSAVEHHGSTPLIDTLPMNKQRQVYSLVSGLQGGIEHIQRELDSLKRALGISDED